MTEWKLTTDMTREERYAGGYLLHGPALVDLDFNPQGVELGHWQDDAVPGSWRDGTIVESADVPSEGGCWCVPGWDANNDLFYTRYVAPSEITHYARIPVGPHSREQG